MIEQECAWQVTVDGRLVYEGLSEHEARAQFDDYPVRPRTLRRAVITWENVEHG